MVPVGFNLPHDHDGVVVRTLVPYYLLTDLVDLPWKLNLVCELLQLRFIGQLILPKITLHYVLQHPLSFPDRRHILLSLLQDLNLPQLFRIHFKPLLTSNDHLTSSLLSFQCSHWRLLESRQLWLFFCN